MQRTLAELQVALRTAGVKVTPQRLEIFREVASSMDHPDAETVYRGVKKRMPSVSLDTVYRTLWLLGEVGLVSTLGPRRESVRFDANLTHHHHYVCVRCGLARDIGAADLEGLHLAEAVRGLGSVESAQLEVRGVCARCAKKEPASKPAPRH
jgi:Fur family peroxide stress response transcriptional regulator